MALMYQKQVYKVDFVYKGINFEVTFYIENDFNFGDHEKEFSFYESKFSDEDLDVINEFLEDEDFDLESDDEINIPEPTKEKFTCHYCGCEFWVDDRNEFECPNCDSFKVDQTIEALRKIGFKINSNIKYFDDKILEYADSTGEITKENFIDFINEKTEWNLCDKCNAVTESQDLIWLDYQNDQKAQSFLDQGFVAVCEECWMEV